MIVSLAACLLLSACGLKSSLYLPDSKQARTASSQPATQVQADRSHSLSQP